MANLLVVVKGILSIIHLSFLPSYLSVYLYIYLSVYTSIIIILSAYLFIFYEYSSVVFCFLIFFLRAERLTVAFFTLRYVLESLKTFMSVAILLLYVGGCRVCLYL